MAQSDPQTAVGVAEELISWGKERGAPIDGLSPQHFALVCSTSAAQRALVSLMSTLPSVADKGPPGRTAKGLPGPAQSKASHEQLKLAEARDRGMALATQIDSLSADVARLSAQLCAGAHSNNHSDPTRSANVRATLRRRFERQLRLETSVADAFGTRMRSFDSGIPQCTFADPDQARAARDDVANTTRTVLTALCGSEQGTAGQVDAALENLRRTHGAECLISALTAEAMDATDRVATSRDANVGDQPWLRRLQYRCERFEHGEPRYIDESGRQAGLESVHRVVQQCQQEYLESFSRMDAARKRAAELQTELQQAEQRLVTRLRENYSGNQAVATTAATATAHLCAQARKEAAARAADAAIDAVSALRARREESLRTCRAKHAQIHGFAERANATRRLIETIAAHNRQALQQLLVELERTREIATTQMDTLLMETAGLVERSKGDPIKEDQLLAQAHLETLRWDSSRSTRLLNLSIHRGAALGRGAVSGQDVGQLTMPHKGSDAVIPDVIDRKRQIASAYARDRLLASSEQEVSGPATSVEPTMLKVQQQDRHYLEAVLPVLSACETALDGSIRQATRGHVLVDEWARQPAQYLAAGLKRGGLNIRNWQDKLRLPTSTDHPNKMA